MPENRSCCPTHGRQERVAVRPQTGIQGIESSSSNSQVMEAYSNHSNNSSSNNKNNCNNKTTVIITATVVRTVKLVARSSISPNSAFRRYPKPKAPKPETLSPKPNGHSPKPRTLHPRVLLERNPTPSPSGSRSDFCKKYCY